MSTDATTTAIRQPDTHAVFRSEAGAMPPEAWARGPAISLACAGCGAAAGVPCRRPQGGNEVVCFTRDAAALRHGLLRRCRALTWDGRHTKPQRLACDPALLPAATTIPGQDRLL
jgi:hypothetical protein